MHPLMTVLFFFTQWSAPVNLGIPGVEDRNPQTCREQLWESPTCLVWQSFIGGNWEIFSRVISSYWTDTVRIPAGAGADINPAVAYDTLRNRFWCTWQGYTDNNWEIFVSSKTVYGLWTAPLRLTNDTNADASPSICVIGTNVWIVWRKDNNIYSCFYNGTSWSAPIPVTNDPTIMNDNPRINNRHNNPFIVWVRNRDIYYSEYIGNTWTVPQAIASHPANDTMPEIAVTPQYPDPYRRVWVLWQSNRDGNYEIYRTGYDSMNVFYRLTNNSSNDLTPNPLDYEVLVRYVTPNLCGFSTDRNGTYDIYSLFFNFWGGCDTVPVDINPAQDILPVTTMVNGHPSFLWIFWNTDRNGDWDIYGSYTTISSGIQESTYKQKVIDLACLPNPASGRCFFTFSLKKSGNFNLTIYNATGELVKRIDSEIKNPGKNCAEIGVDFLSNGVYFLKLETDESVIVEKLIVMK
ncbi:MAG: T9SS type A sorting domain-containing protein [candidate division WOR-3 bacterium]|nr:T9SS type A sorting domain-containing protein [candidate division WOR-3 bacterium]